MFIVSARSSACLFVAFLALGGAFGFAGLLFDLDLSDALGCLFLDVGPFDPLLDLSFALSSTCFLISKTFFFDL
jgi:hypothetical protein